MAKAKPITGILRVLFLVLFVAGCVPESVHPLSDPAQAKVDARLVGLWSARIDKEDAILHFVPRSDGWTEIVMVTYRNQREDGEWSVFRMFPSRIDGRDYMNVRFIAEAAEKAPSKRFHLARYRLSPDGALTIWSMSAPAGRSAIQNGLKGSIRKARFGDDILIEAKPAELAEFLRGTDSEKLFSNRIGAFRRIRF